jgi:hypothetical protein
MERTSAPRIRKREPSLGCLGSPKPNLVLPRKPWLSLQSWLLLLGSRPDFNL